MNIEADVKHYYDRNTRRFITFGEGAYASAIHRGIHHPDAEDPFRYQERRILDIMKDVGAETVIDLGCGVGSSLAWLADHHACRYWGITLSSRQAEMAETMLAGRNISVVAGSYLDESFYESLPEPKSRRLFFGIESWLHCADPALLFQRIADHSKGGDILILWDDFLTEASMTPLSIGHLQDFRQGWHGVNTMRPDESDAMARLYGFENILDIDHTPWLDMDRWRDRVIAVAVPLLRPLKLDTPWWHNLLGGNALRILSKNGWMTYRMRVWKRRDT